MDEAVRRVKTNKNILVQFPRDASEIRRGFDFCLLPVVMNSRREGFLNFFLPNCAKVCKKCGIKTVPIGYLVLSQNTSVQWATDPIISYKPSVISAYLDLAEALGLKAIYFEAGSGAVKKIPKEILRIAGGRKIPVIVGGGIRKFSEAKKLFALGIDYVVVGTALEKNGESFWK
jgi:putative glycerol-1-phosphate prenyltransferase